MYLSQSKARQAKKQKTCHLLTIRWCQRCLLHQSESLGQEQYWSDQQPTFTTHSWQNRAPSAIWAMKLENSPGPSHPETTLYWWNNAFLSFKLHHIIPFGDRLYKKLYVCKSPGDICEHPCRFSQDTERSLGSSTTGKAHILEPYTCIWLKATDMKWRIYTVWKKNVLFFWKLMQTSVKSCKSSSLKNGV